MPKWETFGERLEWALDTDGRSRGDVAGAMGMAQGRLSEWTNDEKPKGLRLESLQALGAAVSWLSLDWLVMGRGSPYRSADKAEANEKFRDLLIALAAQPEKVAGAKEAVVRMLLDLLQEPREETGQPE